MALELLRLDQPLDALLIPLGNGAMLNGIARVMKERSPNTRIVAVQAAGAPAMIESWKQEKIVVHEKINTIADGIAVRVPVPQALTDMQGWVDDAYLVKEETILQAMKILHTRAGVVSEPSGAVGIAAILENQSLFASRRVGAVICGSNLTENQIKKWL
jgi:threonine dehydratase